MENPNLKPEEEIEACELKNVIQVGDIKISSNELEMPKLIGYFKTILTDESFKEYLDIIKLKSLTRPSYIG